MGDTNVENVDQSITHAMDAPAEKRQSLELLMEAQDEVAALGPSETGQMEGEEGNHPSWSDAPQYGTNPRLSEESSSSGLVPEMGHWSEQAHMPKITGSYLFPPSLYPLAINFSTPPYLGTTAPELGSPLPPTMPQAPFKPPPPLRPPPWTATIITTRQRKPSMPTPLHTLMGGSPPVKPPPPLPFNILMGLPSTLETTTSFAT